MNKSQTRDKDVRNANLAKPSVMTTDARPDEHMMNEHLVDMMPAAHASQVTAPSDSAPY